MRERADTGRRGRRLLGAAAVLIVSVLAVAAAGVLNTLSGVMNHGEPAPLPAGVGFEPGGGFRPAGPARWRALLVMGSDGTEVTDLLAPYEILSTSGAFDVATVGASRRLLALTGSVAARPDHAFDAAPHADLIVVPAVIDPEEEALVDWLKTRASEARLVLSICEGARVLAHAGLLDGRRATTHFFALPGLQRANPSVRFAPGHRYVVDGNVMTSAGVSASFDATLAAIEMFAGRPRAETTARALEYDWLREPDPRAEVTRPPSPGFSSTEIARLVLRAAFDWRKRRAAVWLEPGVSEIGLAAVLDTLPRTFDIVATTVSAPRRPIRTRHGMTLVAASDAGSARSATLWVLPTRGPSATGEALSLPAAIGSRTPPDAIHDFRGRAAGQAFPDLLRLVARLDGSWSASVAARQIEYPGEFDVAARP